MGGGVVEHDVAVQVCGDFGVDFLEERQKFLGAMTGMQRADDLAGRQVQAA
jgi:hypothetical protein